ncbi:MAG TPA: carbonic anhydrase [Acidimicrobiales bacterium]|nr:carbonic anhydrase [Acidimicrobiales bacterium]
MLDDLLAANRSWAAGFDLGGLGSSAAAGLAIVTCMDVRIDPLSAFGLRPGDANVIRNAGARVTGDALRSLAMATAFLGVREIAVVQHTGCAMAGRSDDDVRAALPPEIGARSGGWDFLAMLDPEAALAADVERVRTCALIPAGVRVEGWRYDVQTGLLDPVVPAATTTGPGA